jgi:ribose transport system permease protein
MEKTSNNFVRFLSKRRALTLLLLMIALAAIMSLLFTDTYLSKDNLGIILLSFSSDALILIGISMLLIMGEIDLSLGAQVLLGGMLCGKFMISFGWPMVPAILVSLLVAALLGAFNGFIVAKLGVVSFISTLATGLIYQGLTLLIAGSSLAAFPDSFFLWLGQGVLFDFIQMPVIYTLVIFILFSYLMTQSKFFRQLYFIGGNLKSATLSGINVYKTKIIVYVIAAMLACLSGIITAMRFDVASTKIGLGVELRAVTAAVIGGVGFAGGSGNMQGAAMGGLFVVFLNNALTIAHVSPDIQNVLIGIVLIVAVILDGVLTKRSAVKG